MPEISHREVKKIVAGKDFSPVYLFFGEEVLAKGAFQTLLDALLPEEERNFNYEPLDGGDPAGLSQALERVNTFSLLNERKVVALLESRVFHSRQRPETLLQQALEFLAGDEGLKAARHFAAFLASSGMTFEDLQADGRQRVLAMDDLLQQSPGHLDELVRACRTHKVSLPASQDEAAVLQAAVEKGFPPRNHLIIVADLADKRRGLYQAIRDRGWVVDCSVPKGERRADKTAQETVLAEKMRELLARHGKRMDPDAFPALVDLTGFDLRIFTDNLEKLIDYSGSRERITAADVSDVLDRTKTDPIFALTNAVMDRHPGNALFFLDSLLAGETHPLQILAAVANQMRRLLVVKGFAESPAGRVWQPGMSYGAFQRDVMPAVQAFDKSLVELVHTWQQELGDGTASKGKGRKKSKAATDLAVAKNPKSAYPVYQSMKNAQHFSMEEIKAGILRLSEVDVMMKSSGRDPRLLLEDAILRICRREA